MQVHEDTIQYENEQYFSCDEEAPQYEQDKETFPATYSTTYSLTEHDIETFIQNMMQRLKLKRKHNAKEDLKHIQLALHKIPYEPSFNINHLEWMIRVDTQTDKTPFQMVLEEEKDVIRQIQSKQKQQNTIDSLHLEALYAELEHWQALKENPLCKEEKEQYETKQQIDKLMSILPQLQTIHKRFHNMLHTIQLQNIMNIESGHNRWKTILASKYKHMFSYPFCNRILQAQYRLIYVLHSKITLDQVVQEPTFKWTELFREEYDAILYNVLDNTFQQKHIHINQLTTSLFYKWFNGLKEWNRKQVWNFIQVLMNKKYDTNGFKEHYGFIRGAFRQKQIVKLLPYNRLLSKMEMTTKNIKKIQHLLENTTNSKERYHLRNIQLRNEEKIWKTLMNQKQHTQEFPYDETQWNHHKTWLNKHNEYKTILEAF